LEKKRCLSVQAAAVPLRCGTAGVGEDMKRNKEETTLRKKRKARDVIQRHVKKLNKKKPYGDATDYTQGTQDKLSDMRARSGLGLSVLLTSSTSDEGHYTGSVPRGRQRGDQ